MNAEATNHIQQTELRVDKLGKRNYDLIPEHARFRNGHTALVKCSTCKGKGCEDCDNTGKMEIQF